MMCQVVESLEETDISKICEYVNLKNDDLNHIKQRPGNAARISVCQKEIITPDNVEELCRVLKKRNIEKWLNGQVNKLT